MFRRKALLISFVGALVLAPVVAHAQTGGLLLLGGVLLLTSSKEKKAAKKYFVAHHPQAADYAYKRYRKIEGKRCYLFVSKAGSPQAEARVCVERVEGKKFLVLQ